ncbi:MAG: hypothetical protein KGL04_05345 [Elusimicrobia bacterium]|nr:hypothetical protein [Elusimicrobiota bacterium]
MPRRYAAKDDSHPQVRYWAKASGTLYWVAAILGVACILDTLHQSFSQGLWLPFEPLYYLYFPVLTAYAAARDREKRVRRAQAYEKRMGEFFLWAWIGVVILIWLRQMMHYAASIPPTLKPTLAVVLSVFAGVKIAGAVWPIVPFDPDNPNDPDAPPQPSPAPGPQPGPNPEPAPSPQDDAGTRLIEAYEELGEFTAEDVEQKTNLPMRAIRGHIGQMIRYGKIQKISPDHYRWTGTS